VASKLYISRHQEHVLTSWH